MKGLEEGKEEERSGGSEMAAGRVRGRTRRA